jgi:hypothetical protein
MDLRKTEVAWDPTLVRLEHLDAEGTPYYCSFEKRCQPSESAAAQSGTGRDALLAGDKAEALIGMLIGVLVGMALVEETRTKMAPARRVGRRTAPCEKPQQPA